MVPLNVQHLYQASLQIASSWMKPSKDMLKATLTSKIEIEIRHADGETNKCMVLSSNAR